MFLDANDVLNDLARLLHNDRVANPNILAGNLFDVVQSHAANRRPGYLHRLQLRRRSQRTALADRDQDIVDARRRFILFDHILLTFRPCISHSCIHCIHYLQL